MQKQNSGTVLSMFVRLEEVDNSGIFTPRASMNASIIINPKENTQKVFSDFDRGSPAITNQVRLIEIW